MQRATLDAHLVQIALHRNTAWQIAELAIQTARQHLLEKQDESEGLSPRAMTDESRKRLKETQLALLNEIQANVLGLQTPGEVPRISEYGLRCSNSRTRLHSSNATVLHNLIKGEGSIYEDEGETEEGEKAAHVLLPKGLSDLFRPSDELPRDIDGAMRFVIDCLDELAVCRFVLKWAYATLFYARGLTDEQKIKRRLVEHHVELLVETTERIHDTIESTRMDVAALLNEKDHILSGTR